MNMTLERLDQYRSIRAEIYLLREQRERYMEKACSVTQSYGGMPGSTNASDKIGTIVSIYVDLFNDSLDKEYRLAVEEAVIREYINSIQDSITRQIFMLRFVNGYSWKQVARRLPGSNSETGAKNICYRYLEKAC